MNKKKELFEHLESNEIKAIKESTDDKDLNMVLLKTVDYLMRNAYELSINTLSSYDEMEIDWIFAAFGKVAQKTCEFYQASKKHLDPAVLNEKIMQKLEITTQEVTRVKALMESIEKNNTDLLKKQEELNEKDEAYKKMEENIIRLKKIEETITEEAFNKLKQEHTELDLHLGENSIIAVKLKEYGISRIDDFSTEMDNLKNGVKNELARFDNIIKKVIEKLEEEKIDIGRRNKTSQ